MDKDEYKLIDVMANFETIINSVNILINLKL